MDTTCLPKRADRSKMRITSSIPKGKCRAVPIGRDVRSGKVKSAGEVLEEYAPRAQYASATLEVCQWMRPVCPNVRTGRRCESHLQFQMESAGPCRQSAESRRRRRGNPPVKSARNMRCERNTRPRPWRSADGYDLPAQTCGPVEDANHIFNSKWKVPGRADRPSRDDDDEEIRR